MVAPSKTSRILTITLITLSGLTYVGIYNPVFATTPSQFESQTITGIDLKNNPMAAKILNEIEYSKKQVAALEKSQQDQEANQKLVEQQRLIAKQLEDQAYQALQIQVAQNSSDNAYDRFLKTIPSNDTQMVFHDEFAFTKQRVSAGDAAMHQVLASGGTWDQAIQEFSKYATIKYTEMISVNQALNDKYIHHPNRSIMIQTGAIPFDQFGHVPDNYIQIPSTVSSHA